MSDHFEIFDQVKNLDDDYLAALARYVAFEDSTNEQASAFLLATADRIDDLKNQIVTECHDIAQLTEANHQLVLLVQSYESDPLANRTVLIQTESPTD